ncbi:hypothetical protein KK083_15620 [Fulvivirgaceae bacterium PWU4]|uniref:Cytochrome c domain-containing protein n=1 Tax=Chryseosolibacter histidini TaxID=2782349 RepID=A0AAP2GJS2_9BACT|nr:c-type cytochrome domain-containing protein [Chryseosolibacter histidini]MBT1698319.1 hypothetical protein [Chryseosolibacter histidini]
MIQLLGRFHPLIVHLPIGFLLLAFLFECLSLTERYAKLKIAVQPGLFIGAVSSIVACITGYLLRQEGGYDDDLADAHQYFGIATAAFATLLFFLRRKLKTFYLNPDKRKQVRVMLFVPLVVLLSATGHWGGSLTHGESYLSFTEAEDPESTDPAHAIGAIADPKAAIFYGDVIKPLLEARCYSCHSAKKQKGQLRLDGPAYIERGGKKGAVLVTGVPDSSTLYTRLMLPPDHDHHMPPSEKPQLTSTEIALIGAWIKDGASFDKPVAAFADADKIAGYLSTYKAGGVQETWIPEEEIGAPDNKIIDRLKAEGVLVVPVSATSNYRMVNFVNRKNVSDETLKNVVQLGNHVVWMNLGFSAITDEQLRMVSRLSNLRVLYLNNTGITDRGVTNIKDLRSLKYLNLVGTETTDQTLATLAAMDQLKKVYLYRNRMSRRAVLEYLRQTPTVVADTGNYQLEKLATDTITYKRKT